MSVDELLTGEKEEAPKVKILPESERKNINDMMLRIVVDSHDGDKVRVNLPFALIETAIDSGLNISQGSGSDALNSIDFGKIIDMVKNGAVGNLVEIDSSDGDTVRIFVE